MEYDLGALVSIAAVAVVVIAMASSNGCSGEGEQAQDFDFSMFQGIEEVGFREGNLASIHGQGKPMILNFWAGLCPTGRAEMPQFQVFHAEFKDDIQLLGIDIGLFTGLGSLGDTDVLLRELGVRYPAGWADDGRPPQIGCESHVYRRLLGRSLEIVLPLIRIRDVHCLSVDP